MIQTFEKIRGMCMKVFDYVEEFGHEQIVFCNDKETGLKAIIAIHDTTLGPAVGGTRIRDYETEDEALQDVLRLSRGMTYKNAAAGLAIGGGKAVIIGDPEKVKNEALLRSFGKFVESLNGKFITAEDMNTNPTDIAYMNKETDHVIGLEGKSGDPSPVTAFGIYRGILAAVDHVYGSQDLTGKVVAVQGLGAVGYRLCQHLHDAGAKLYVSNHGDERLEQAAKEFGATIVESEDIYSVECDVFSPCAIGAIINDETIKQFKCKIIAGAANNQLAENRHGDILTEKGILYIPDYVINSGGVINAYEEMIGYNKERAMTKATAIYDKIKEIIDISIKENIATYVAADRMAENVIEKAKKENRR